MVRRVRVRVGVPVRVGVRVRVRVGGGLVRVGGCGVGVALWLSGWRLWGRHSSRPLSCEVGPPSLWGWMWSMSQVVAGSSQPEGCWQRRSRTSIARRRAPVKRRLWDTAMTRSGPSKTTRSMSASASRGTTSPGAMTVPVANSHSRAKRVFADEDGEQRARSQPAVMGGAGAAGHLDQGVEAALPGRCATGRRVAGRARYSRRSRRCSSVRNSAPPSGSNNARRSTTPSKVVAAEAVRPSCEALTFVFDRWRRRPVAASRRPSGRRRRTAAACTGRRVSLRGRRTPPAVTRSRRGPAGRHDRATGHRRPARRRCGASCATPGPGAPRRRRWAGRSRRRGTAGRPATGSRQKPTGGGDPRPRSAWPGRRRAVTCGVGSPRRRRRGRRRRGRGGRRRAAW